MHEEPSHTLDVSQIHQDLQPAILSPATFWQRFGASIIDSLITGLIGIITGGILGALIGLSTGDVAGAEAGGYIMGTLGGWLYHALLESSGKQASFGKQLLKIKVADEYGDKISFGRATGRYFGKTLSSLIMCLGYFMMLWTKKSQTLHDKMAKCVVVKAS